MTSLTKLRFRTKINIGLALIVGLTAMIIALFVTRMASTALVEQSRMRGKVLASNLALRAEDPMLSVDLLQLKSMVNELKKVDNEIVYAFIMDSKNRILATTFNDGFPIQLKAANIPNKNKSVTAVTISTGHEEIYDFAAPIFITDKKIGTVRVGLSSRGINTVVRNLIYAISALTGAVLLLAVLASTHFARRMTFRLGRLQRYAEDLVATYLGAEQKNCCATKTPKNNLETTSISGDEIEDLTITFDAMAQSLECHITDLQKTEKNLTRQRELLKTIINVSPDFVSLIGPDLKYLTINKPFADAIGTTPEHAIGLSDEQLFPKNEAILRKEEALQIFKTGKIINKEEKKYLDNFDQPRWYHIIKVPVYSGDKRVIGVLTTSRDITELKSYQTQLIQSQKMESVGKLAGGVAHEINTPLGIILGYSQLLQDDFNKEDSVYSDLQIIEKQARVCRKIVADLLGFSRQVESQKIEMCFNNSILEIVQLVSHTFKLENVEITTDMDDRLPIIHGDPEKLKQVWLNLLSNALEAIESKGQIYLKTVLDVKSLTITAYFADTGSGIDPRNINKIFDPFYSTKPVGKGTGLGLSVSFGIIEDHGGTIEAISPIPFSFRKNTKFSEKESNGTVFKVTLPLDALASDESYSID